MKKKGIKEDEIDKLNALKNLPICRWDLFILISKNIKNKEIRGLFEKMISFYDFDNPRQI